MKPRVMGAETARSLLNPAGLTTFARVEPSERVRGVAGVDGRPSFSLVTTADALEVDQVGGRLMSVNCVTLLITVPARETSRILHGLTSQLWARWQ